MKNKILVVGSIIVAIIFVLGGIYYWITPADALPTFFPGYDATMTGIHFKHGLGLVVLALALGAFAWFKSGEKKEIN
ncbi:MAG: hypothetical protein WCQ60_03595 [bacterium]